MEMIFYFSLLVLLGLLGGQVVLKVSHKSVKPENKLRIYQYAGIAAVIGVFGLLLYYSWQQFLIWNNDGVGQFLLTQPVPLRELLGNAPIESVNYFVFYVFTRFFADYIVSLVAALLFLWAALRYNKKYSERFFHPEEPYLGAMGIFLSSHPGWLFYFVGFIILYLIIHIVASAIKTIQYAFGRMKGSGEITNYQLPVTRYRIPLYWLWIPSAIFAILIQNMFLSQLSLWRLLII